MDWDDGFPCKKPENPDKEQQRLFTATTTLPTPQRKRRRVGLPPAMTSGSVSASECSRRCGTVGEDLSKSTSWSFYTWHKSGILL